MSSPQDGSHFPRNIDRSSFHTRIPSVSSRPSTPTLRPYSSTPPQSPRPSSLRTVSTPPPSPSKSLQRIHARRLAGLSTPSVSTRSTSDATERSASRISRSASTRNLRSFIPEPYRRHAHSSSTSAVGDTWIEAAAAEEGVGVAAGVGGRRGRFVQRVRSALNLKPRELRVGNMAERSTQRVQRREAIESGGQRETAMQERHARSESTARGVITEPGFADEENEVEMDPKREIFQRGNRRRRSPASEIVVPCGIDEALETTETGLGRFKRRRLLERSEDIPLFGYSATKAERKHVSLRSGYERTDTSFVNRRRGSMAPASADDGGSRIEAKSRYVSSIPRYERIGSNVLNRRRSSTTPKNNTSHRLFERETNARLVSSALEHQYPPTTANSPAQGYTNNTIEDDEIDCLVQLYASEDPATTDHRHTPYSARSQTPDICPSQTVEEHAFSLASCTKTPQTDSSTYHQYPTPSHSQSPSLRGTPTLSYVMHTRTSSTGPRPCSPLLHNQTLPQRSSPTLSSVASTAISPKLVAERPRYSLPSRSSSRTTGKLVDLQDACVANPEPTSSYLTTPPAPSPLSLSPVVYLSAPPTTEAEQTSCLPSQLPTPPLESLAFSPILCTSSSSTPPKTAHPRPTPYHPPQVLSLSAVQTTCSISPIRPRTRRSTKKMRPSPPVHKLEPSPVKLFAPYTVSRIGEPLPAAATRNPELARSEVLGMWALLLVSTGLGVALGFLLRGR